MQLIVREVHELIAKAIDSYFLQVFNHESDGHTFYRDKSLLVILYKAKPFSIEIIEAKSSMRNVHRHSLNNFLGSLSKWIVSPLPFWDVKHGRKELDFKTCPDYYVFHSCIYPNKNIIVSASEFALMMNKKIDNYLIQLQAQTILPEHLDDWYICDLCFEELPEYNNWNKIRV